MVRNGVVLAAKDGKVRPLRPAPVLVGSKDNERAPWLDPYGGDPGDTSKGFAVARSARQDRLGRRLTAPHGQDEPDGYRVVASMSESLPACSREM